MVLNAMSRPIHRPVTTRRTFIGGAALLTAMSAIQLAWPPAGARRKAKHAKPAKKLNEKEPYQANPEAVQAEKQGGKVETRTFSSPNVIVINDDQPADPYPSTIQVAGIKKGKVTDVNVILRGLNHSQPENIDVVLVGPTGAGTFLMSDSGGPTDALSFTLKIDDEAGLTLPDNTALSSGTYLPANYGNGDLFPNLAAVPTAASLSVFDGSNPNGEWRLYVVDDVSTHTGAFSGGWDLELTVKLAKKKHGHGGKH